METTSLVRQRRTGSATKREVSTLTSDKDHMRIGIDVRVVAPSGMLSEYRYVDILCNINKKGRSSSAGPPIHDFIVPIFTTGRLPALIYRHDNAER
jgi:hypothetical protein